MIIKLGVIKMDIEKIVLVLILAFIPDVILMWALVDMFGPYGFSGPPAWVCGVVFYVILASAWATIVEKLS